MLHPLHHLVDQLTGILLSFPREMKIDHGGLKLSVAHVSLDDPRVDSGLEEVRGIGMTRGVNADALLADTGLELGATEGAVDTTFCHCCGTLFCALAIMTKRRKQETGIPMGNPIAAQKAEGRMRQWNIGILRPLAPMHVNHCAVAVDIGDFRMQSFLKPETAGINGSREGLVLGSLDTSQQALHLFYAEHRGQ